jgi:exodeoxyribonuclease V alpha subunit
LSLADRLSGWAGPAELAVAEVITRGHDDELLTCSAALAVWAPLHGHTCIDLPVAAATVAAEQARLNAEGHAPGEQVSVPEWWPPGEWCARLAASPLVRVVAHHDDVPVLDEFPLVLHDTRLYTQRQWVDECTVAAGLRHLAERPPAQVPEAGSAVLAEVLPPSEADGSVNEQHRAGAAMLARHLTVVVGGPGTGKTHTLARALSAFVEAGVSLSGRPPSIGLAAPTGKAAARLSEAIAHAASALPAERAHVLRGVQAVTLHRLLGHRPGAFTRFRHHAGNPLPYDVVVVDETSMVALPLMARLIEALSPSTRLVLVGDPDQLESVEVGSVLADVVAAPPGSAVASSVVRLHRQHRQLGDSPLAGLADAIRRADADTALAVIAAGAPSVTISDRTSGPASARAAVGESFGDVHRAAISGEAAAALAGLGSVRVLCAHRRGPFGVERWNRTIEGWLDEGIAGRSQWFPGRMVAVTRNDVRTQLANGDSGVVIATAGGPQVCFDGPHGVRSLHPAQLDAVDTAFAVTVHKSQGSEYEHVVVVLPPPESPLVSRELLYTAVTRARRTLLLIGSTDSVRACIAAPARRISGLVAALGDGQPRPPGQLALFV